eukprot:COSAG05_NODE_424_length_9929_cov_25.816378_5_plen_569_part_00
MGAGSDPDLSRTLERYRSRRETTGLRDAQYTSWALKRWTSWSKQCASSRARGAELCVAWRRRRRLAAAFHRCAQQVGRREIVRAALSDLLCRRVRRVLQLTVRQWRCGILTSKCDRATELQDWQIWAHLEAYRRRRVASGVRYILYRMRSRYLRASLSTWRGGVVRHRRFRLLFAIATRGTTHRVLCQTFATWVVLTFTNMRSSQRIATCNAIAAHIRRRMMDDAAWWLREWRRGLDMRQRATRVLATQLSRIQRRGKSGVFEAWAKFTATTKKRTVVCRCALLRLQHGCIAGALAGWRENARENQRKRSVVRRAALRLIQKNLSMAFAAWADFVLRLRKISKGMAVVIGRILGRSLSKALTAWVAMVSEAVRQRVICKRALGRVINQTASRALEGWRERASAQLRRRQLCARAMGRMQNKLLVSMYTRWAALTQESAAAEMEAQRAAATVDVAVLQSLVTEYDQQKQLWGERLHGLGHELDQARQLVAQQREQLEQMATEKAKLESELQRTNDATTLCEGLMAQLMDGNQRLRREKKSLELAIDHKVSNGDISSDSLSEKSAVSPVP